MFVCVHMRKCALCVHSVFFSNVCFYLTNYSVSIQLLCTYSMYICMCTLSLLSLCINFTLLLNITFAFFFLYMNIKFCIPCSKHLQPLMGLASPAVHFNHHYLVMISNLYENNTLGITGFMFVAPDHFLTT